MENTIKISREDFSRYVPSFIEELFGKQNEIVVNKEIAKKIYIAFGCTFLLCNCQKLKGFILENFKEDIENWDDEYLLMNIGFIENALLEDNFEFNNDIDMYLHRLFKYTANKEVLEKIILIIEKLGKKAGFRNCLCEGILHHSDFGPDPEAYEELIGSFPSSSYKSTKISKFPNAKHFGLIQSLFYNNYNDLLKETIDRILIPCANACITENKDLMDIWFYKYYTEPKEMLFELNSELAKYFEDGVDYRIKRGKSVTPKTQLHQEPYSLTNETIRINVEGKPIFAKVYKLFDDIFVTNLSFLDRYGVNCFDQINDEISIINKNYENDIAVFKWNYPKLTDIFAINKEVKKGDYIHIEGKKAFFYKNLLCVPDINVMKNLGNDFKEKKINEEDLLSLLLNNRKYGEWLPAHCISFGEVIKVTESGYIVDAPFSKDVYGAAAFSDNGDFVGIVKTLDENSDYVEIVSYDSIVKLANKVK